MNKMKTAASLVALFLLASFLSAQQLQTGSIRGVVKEKEGIPLPGVTITVKSPALIGSVTNLTNADGEFRAPGLPPGTYTLTAELAGFATIRREGLIVHVGMTLTIDVQMEPSTIAEEVRVVAASPVVDIRTTKVSTTVTLDITQNLPVSRDFTLLVNTMPGVVGTRSGLIRGSSSMHGGGGTSHAVDVDGANVNDPAMHEIFTDIQYDSIQEIEVASGGLPAQVGNTSGGFINIVTSAGGNTFHGQLQGYYTNEDMVGIPIPDYQIQSMGVVKPAAPILDYTVSGNLGGPIIRDKLWFYSSLSYRMSKERGKFIPTIILGKQYNTYDFLIKQWEGLLKFTTQISPSLRAFVMLAGVNRNLPYSGTSATTAAEAYQSYIFHRLTATGNFSWLLGSNTVVDFRASYAGLDYPIPMQEGTENTPRYYDRYTGYVWGSARYAEPLDRVTTQANLQMTHFRDDFLGGDHEFKVGVDVKTGMDKWNWHKGDSQISEWSYYKGNPYYYRGLYGLTGPHPVYGDGRLSFAACGSKEGDSYVTANGLAIGAFIQDSWTIKSRLSVNLGLRMDSYRGHIPEITKQASSELPKSIGAYYFAPLYGLNPFDTITTSEWDNPVSITSLSPRIGLSYDLFGNGKTALKASYSVYREDILVSFFEGVHPFSPKTFTFDWWDLNNNGVPDVAPVDKYNPQPADVRGYSEAYYKNKINKDLKPSKWQEAIVGIQHELVQNLNVGAKYIYKVLTNPFGALLYDLSNQRFLYSYETGSDYWVPFTTRVPAIGTFPEKAVTMYFPKNNHPDWFTLTSNLPNAKTTYQAAEFTFDKRMSRGWQFGGSVVLSKLYGIGGDGRSTYEGGGSEITPNYWVNREGRKSNDRPLVVKVYGTFNLPLRFLGSFYYIYESGSPFGRTVTVYPPSKWAAANNVRNVSYTVNVFSVGTERIQAYSNLDVRLEKKFSVGKIGEVGIFADVLNLLSNRIVYVGDNPGGTWRPADENTNVGTYTPDSFFGRVRAIEGARILKLSVRFAF